MRRTPRALLLGAALAGAVGPARADDDGPPPARPPPGLTRALLHVAGHLDLTLGTGTERCPPEDALHAQLLRLDGYDPFEPGAEGPRFGEVHVTIARAGNGLEATSSYDDENGARRWTKTFAVPGTSTKDCEVVYHGVATSISMALTRFAALPPPAPPAPQEPPASAVVLLPPAPPAPPRPRSLRPQPEIGLGVLGSLGTGAHPTVSGVLEAGVSLAPFASERTRLLFAVEGRADSVATDAYNVQTQLFTGSLVFCGGRDVWDRGPRLVLAFQMCAVGTAGAVRASVQNQEGWFTQSVLYGALGVRLGIEARFASVAVVRPQIGILPTLGDPRGTVQGHEVSVASVAGTLGLSGAFLP